MLNIFEAVDIPGLQRTQSISTLTQPSRPSIVATSHRLAVGSDVEFSSEADEGDVNIYQ